MRRTLYTAIEIWMAKGFFWPVKLIFGLAGNHLKNLPRGLVVEPSERCTGFCEGCPIPEKPYDLPPDTLKKWLESRPVKPVNIHFAGKHSDPLASPCLAELVGIAEKQAAMVTVSTIGLGMTEEMEELPVDRWIFSIPAATEESWWALRGTGRLGEFKEILKRVVKRNRAMVELVLTVWKQSSGDLAEFEKLAEESGVYNLNRVFGRYDPEGHHLGRAENLALEENDCPYELDENGVVKLKQETPCPFAGTLFLDAAGVLHPCPYTGSEDPALTVPCEGSWKMAAGWADFKTQKRFSCCKYCL